MKYLQFKIFGPYKNTLTHGLSTRYGGVSGREAATQYLASLNLALDLGVTAAEAGGQNDSTENLAENYRRFCAAVGVDENKILTGIQVHGDNIFCLKRSERNVASKTVDVKTVAAKTISAKTIPPEFGWQKPLEHHDGLITNVPGVPLMVRFADCQGVLMFDPVNQVIAAVHSGWRGNAQNIIGKAVDKMVAEFGSNAENILVGISQSLGPCCAEFKDTENELPDWMQKYASDGGTGNPHCVDLWRCSFDQLTEAGVQAKNIEIMRRCTVCENDVFFSSRAGKKKMGLMGAIIQMDRVRAQF